MKANELMLGDFVTFADCQDDIEKPIIKIWQINEDNLAFAAIDNHRYVLDEIEIDDEIVGIPITPEILEKNGWKWDGMYASLEHDDNMELIFYPSEGILRDYYVHKSGEAELVFLSRSGMNYVHQLQHCLILLNIDKEITL